jgi:hypothetical protein
MKIEKIDHAYNDLHSWNLREMSKYVPEEWAEEALDKVEKEYGRLDYPASALLWEIIGRLYKELDELKTKAHIHL